MENEPSLLDIADEEFAKINKPEEKQDQGSLLDIADEEFNKQEEEFVKKEFDVSKLKQLKSEGKRLSDVQERIIFDEEDKVPLLESAGKAISEFLPAAAQSFGQMASGGYELAKEAVVKPVVVGAGYQLGLASPEEAQKALAGVKPAVRSAVSGVASDIEDTANLATRAFMFGTSFTDKLQGLSADERFKRYRLREDMRNVEQAWREQTPDRAAALLAENPILKKMAGVAAKMQGATEEEAKEAEKAYSELVLESGLTKDELNQNISAFGEFLSPLSIPGANLPTKTIGKFTGKAVQKGGELALKGIVKPLATGVEKTAGLTEKGITGVQAGISKLGEYITGDPDTLLRGGSIAGLISAPQITATILAAKPAAIATKEVARTVKDIASQVDVGGAAGRRGLFERAGRAAESGTLTKKLFSPEARGGLGRAKTADWITRQSNAIVQQGVNGSVLNTMLGLPDIESAEQLGQVAGSGFGIGALAGSRLIERTGAIIDPRTGLAQKIDTIITPDPNAIRADEDADIKRFLSSVDPELVPKMEKLGNIDERKKAIQSKIDNLEKQKDITFGPEVESIKERIENQKKQLEALNKSTPETQKEVLRQVHLAFADEMDLAKTTGKAAGLNNIQVKILDPSEMEGFFRNAYGATLTDAESVVANLTGKTDLSPQESENLVNARKVVDRFFNEVAGAQSARGLAISESKDLDGSETPAFMRKQNLQGATIVINGDLVKQLSDEGFNIRNVVGHEMQHALNQFTEVRDMIAPIRRELFDQNIVNEDGTINKVTQGIYSDDKLDEFANRYAVAMSPSDNGESFKAQFDDQNKLRAYIKEEILSEIVGRSGNVSGGTRAGLDSIGRQVVDWIEVSTQNGALKAIKEALRKGGIIVDDSGDISTILGAELTPESLAMIRQYQRQLKNLNQSMVYEDDARKEEVEIPVTKILSDRSLQQKFKNSDIFEKEQIATMTAPDGSKQEILLPPDAGVDPFVGTYRIQSGQLVDENGTPMNLGPQITFGTMPDGTKVEVGTRIARNVDGSPKILSNREVEARSRNRGKIIRNAIDSALSKGALQLEDTGNGNYRGVMSEAQVNAVLALPNTIVSPNLKRQILFVNEILRKKDGTRMWMEYQATMRGGKARALSPQIRDEIPIGFQFSKQGNFLITTMSVSRMHDKMNAWLAKKPENLKLWNGDTTEFWNDVIKVLDNHSKGQVGQTGLDPDPAVAIEKKNAVNDLFNVWNADTKAANPRRTKLPVQKGKDPIDVIVRSRRIDRINQYNESALQKMPFNYELNTQNYMPAENPLAGFQTPEDFSSELPSVTAEEIRSAINTGNLDQLESKLRESDDLKPAESLDEQNGNIRIVSMFDPEFMPEESLDFVDSKTQFMPAEIEAPSGERGFQSKLQMEIQRSFKGAKATPEQLKAVINNPQNVKAEEVKWSGVNDAIDRLASENNGKVPVQELLNYLRDEGQVKFEEVTLGGKEPFDANRLAELEAEYKNLKNHPVDDPSFGEEKYDELIRLMNIRDQSTTDTLYEEAERVMKLAQQAQRRGDKKTAEKYFRENEFLNTRAEKLDLQGEGLANPPKFANLVLPGGENYREVVMAMPDQKLARYNELDKIGATYMTDEQFAEYKQLEKSDLYKNQYTSSHFPDIPNYVAHMRLNERMDVEGNEGLFIEELQSDRHQAGRERGYEGDIKPISAEENKRLSQLTRELHELEYNGIDESNPTQEFIELNREYTELSNRSEKYIKSNVPDAPFRKDWSLQLFKRALRDAVESGKKWIGWTTGIEQVKRYEDAMRQAVDEITWKKPKGDPRKNFAATKNGRTVITGKIKDDGTVYDSTVPDANGIPLSEVVGKSVAAKILAEDSGTAKGDDLTIGGEGMKGFYDTILPKEIGKYVGKMGGKVEKSGIDTDKSTSITVTGSKENLKEVSEKEARKAFEEGKPVFSGRQAEVGINYNQLGKSGGAEFQFKINPGPYYVANEMLGKTPIWRVNITPQMENVVRAGQLQFMPAEVDTRFADLEAKAKAGDKEAEAEAQRMVDERAISQGIEITYPLFRGVRRNPKNGVMYTQGERATLSFTDVPEVAKLYTHNQEFGGITPSPYGSVKKVYLNIKNPLDIRDEGTKVNLGDFIDKYFNWDWKSEDYITEDNVFSGDDLVRLLVRMGKLQSKTEFESDIQSSDPEGIFRHRDFNEVANSVREILDTSESESEAAEQIENILSSIDLDTYALADNKWVIKHLKDQGYDGLIHKDTIEAGKEFFQEESVAGKPIEEIKGINAEDDYSHDTWRPFNKEQIKLSDPFTYDDAGALIPLSERFQPAKSDIRFMPAEQPTKYEPISPRIRPLEGISAPTKVVGAKAPALREIEPPVRAKAMLPDIELEHTISEKPQSSEMIGATISEKPIQSSDIITSAKPAPDAVIKPFSNALVSSAGLINFLPAYHGTPFEVDKFSTEKIGTGEGAQAYGWGLYFAQARKVGEQYRDELSGYDELTIFTDKGKKKGQQLDDLDLESAKYLESGARSAGQFKHNTVYYAKQAAERDGKQDVVARIDEYGRDAKVTYEKNLGNLYKVDLDVKDEDLLDWDKPLSEQSEKVKAALARVGWKEKNAPSKKASEIYDAIARSAVRILPGQVGGVQSDQQKASAKLASLGIPGIRYLDGTSRKKGEGTYNYVIFDENLITILDKNDKPVKDELPRSIGLQFMPAEVAKKGKTTKKEKGKKKETQKQYITVDSGDDETVPVLQEIRDGKPLTDPKGDPKFVQQKYNLLSSPFIDNYSGKKPEDTTKPNYDELAYDVSGVAQKKINAAIDSGAVDAAANIMVNKTNEAMKNADIAAGSGWYSRMRENLLKALGVEGRELISQLLGATSAKTPVNENFLQAMDAYEGIKSGRYDSNRKAYLEMMDAESKNELNDLIDDRNYIAVIKNKISDLNKASKKVTGKKQKVIQSEVKKLKDLIAIKPEDRTKKNRFSIVINASGLMPLRSNGKKFNANSMAVMKVIAGTWLDNRKAPKTPNFAGNLSGRTVQATIDVWAARFMRQILHEGFGTPWRIQPKSETGVTNEDFALGQIIMQRAAKKLGMNPDDLQAILWFAEKHNWDNRGWTGAEGAEKSSFDEIFSIFFPKGKKPLTFLEASEVLKSQKNKEELIDEDTDEYTDEDDEE